MPLSKINDEMTDEDVNQVLKHLDGAKNLITFLASITNEQRIEMEKKKRKSHSYITRKKTSSNNANKNYF